MMNEEAQNVARLKKKDICTGTVSATSELFLAPAQTVSFNQTVFCAASFAPVGLNNWRDLRESRFAGTTTLPRAAPSRGQARKISTPATGTSDKHIVPRKTLFDAIFGSKGNYT